MAPVVPIEFTGQKECRKFLSTQAMGKSRKLSSKRPSSGFVPDYRHAVETIAESERFGNSARIDTEITGSEDSCDRKRKCISLNMDGNDSFGVPVQVLSLAKLSNIERWALKSRLQKELEQVQNLQSRLTSILAVSPPSDIRSCSDVQKWPFANGIPGPIEPVRHGKKRPGPVSNVSRPIKKGSFERSKAVKAAGPAVTSSTVLWGNCGALLDRLLKHKHSWVFKEPVDVVKLNIPDYFNVIEHPMDLGTVERKLRSGVYSSPLDFSADVRLTFSNAMTYNPPGNDVHVMASMLSKLFESGWKQIEGKLSVTANRQAAPFNSVTHLTNEPNKKKKVLPNDMRSKPEPDVRPIMTDAEKQKMSMELEGLLGELPESIIDFLKEHSSSAEQTADDEIEIEIEALGDSTLLKLRKLVDDYLLEKQKNQDGAGEQVANKPVASTSLLLLCKGNEAADEDVDIVGGNDPPISSFPPVEIEIDKDAVRRSSRCSSPSSSSGDSGSSSSDSDSASSSESESEAVKAPQLEVTFPGDDDAGRKRNGGGGGVDTGNSPVDVVGLAEQDLLLPNEPVSSDRSGPQEEENAQSERQVSPEKMHRAALLRNRFADTILKAQEKTLEKDEKRDREKLQREREELERRLREEKARLEVEAKAAEEARKKAEAKAAADAKKQREMDRELARQALQKMEKTVDINENSQFLEDLELLRAANGESSSMPNFIEEGASPVLSEDQLGGGGGFMLQGSSNPLEQLGLFRKDDDDDDDDDDDGGNGDGDHPQITPPANDVEEGEID